MVINHKNVFMIKYKRN